MDFLFLLNSILLGVGLAMDAFSVSLANGLAEPQMSRRRMGFVAGCYAFFQYLMPVIGWFLVRTAVSSFGVLERLIPWIALLLLLYIGGKMIWEAYRCPPERGNETAALTPGALLLQGVATSIDALSVGFTLVKETALFAQLRALIIAAVTFVICFFGLAIGKKAGLRLKGRALAAGGIILVLIGIEIFVKGIFF